MGSFVESLKEVSGAHERHRAADSKSIYVDDVTKNAKEDLADFTSIVNVLVSVGTIMMVE